MKKFVAFTLAEIMLAMSIVGAVAAMTIPSLLYKRVKHEYSVKLKNFYSRMNNAVIDMVSENGSIADMITPAKGREFAWYMNNIDPYLGHKKVNRKDSIYFADGSSIIFDRDNEECIDLIYDVNGNKAPNHFGYDRYLFTFCFGDRDNRMKYLGDENLFFGVKNVDELRQAGIPREKLVDKCMNDPVTCTVLLEVDGWEYLADYPFKF